MAEGADEGGGGLRVVLGAGVTAPSSTFERTIQGPMLEGRVPPRPPISETVRRNTQYPTTQDMASKELVPPWRDVQHPSAEH